MKISYVFKINDNDCHMVNISQVNPREIFKWGNYIYIKIDDSNSGWYRMFNISMGRLERLPPMQDVMVELFVNSELILER